MSKIKYQHLFTDSWTLLVKHKILFVPNILMLLASMLWTIAYLAVSGLLKLLIKNPAMVYNQVVLSEQIRSFVGAYPIWSRLSFIIYMLLWFLTAVFFATVKYGMIRQLILERKTSFFQGYAFAKKYYRTSLLVHLIRYLLIFGPLVAGGIILYKIGTKTDSLILMTPWIVVALIILLAVLYMIYMMIRLVFIFPTMTFEEVGALECLKKDFHYVATHVGHTIITWILFLVVWATYVIVRTPLGKIGNKAQNLFIIISITTLIIILSVIRSVWEHLFIFKSYITGKTKKEKKKRKVFKEDESWKGIYK